MLKHLALASASLVVLSTAPNVFGQTLEVSPLSRIQVINDEIVIDNKEAIGFLSTYQEQRDKFDSPAWRQHIDRGKACALVGLTSDAMMKESDVSEERVREQHRYLKTCVDLGWIEVIPAYL